LRGSLDFSIHTARVGKNVCLSPLSPPTVLKQES